MTFNGTIWENVGTAGFSAGEVNYVKLAFSPSGDPYVAFEDLANGGKNTVMMFNHTNWVNVGNAGFSGNISQWQSLAISPSGEPYVAYEDSAYSNRASVMKFNGANWAYVGVPGFSVGSVTCLSLAFCQTGELNVVYCDLQPTYKGIAKKFDGNSWVNIGNTNLSESWIGYLSLAFSPTTGEPYVAFNGGTPSGAFNACAKRFDGANWIFVGPDMGFSSGWADCTSLAFNSNGEPYVAYCDEFDNMKASVMKYDSVLVGTQEPHPAQISIHPNPASEQLVVDVLVGSPKLDLSILNLQGQQVLNRKLWDAKTTIDISPLPSGVYAVKVAGEATEMVRKFVKL